MTSSLVVRPSVSRDVAEAHAYHSQYGRGDAFMLAVHQVFDRIAERPLMFPLVYGDVRRALLRRFAYSAFFVVDGDAVVILAVHHQRRDPSLRPKP
jgi:plasmid stabilization system protein ParE